LKPNLKSIISQATELVWLDDKAYSLSETMTQTSEPVLGFLYSKNAFGYACFDLEKQLLDVRDAIRAHLNGWTMRGSVRDEWRPKSRGI